MDEDVNLGRSIAIWTVVGVVSLAAMVWALAHEGFAAGKLSGLVGLVMAFLTTIGVPSGVWRGRLALAACIALIVIHYWPTARSATRGDAPTLPARTM